MPRPKNKHFINLDRMQWNIEDINCKIIGSYLILQIRIVSTCNYLYVQYGFKWSIIDILHFYDTSRPCFLTETFDIQHHMSYTICLILHYNNFHITILIWKRVLHGVYTFRIFHAHYNNLDGCLRHLTVQLISNFFIP